MARSTGWKRFALAATAATLLVGTVAAPALALSDTDNASTTVTLTVDASIAMTGIPASFSFTHSTVGSTTTAPLFTATIVTNNDAGYVFTVTTSDLTTLTSSDTIPASAVSYDVGGSPKSVTDSSTPTTLATKAARSVESGDAYAVTPGLDIPFVDSGNYEGTAAFVASTL